jgi:hypothetical protein
MQLASTTMSNALNCLNREGSSIIVRMSLRLCAGFAKVFCL